MGDGPPRYCLDYANTEEAFAVRALPECVRVAGCGMGLDAAGGGLAGTGWPSRFSAAGALER